MTITNLIVSIKVNLVLGWLFLYNKPLYRLDTIMYYFTALFSKISQKPIRRRNYLSEDCNWESETHFKESEACNRESEARIRLSETSIRQTEAHIRVTEACIRDTEARITAFVFLRRSYFTGWSTKNH